MRQLTMAAIIALAAPAASARAQHDHGGMQSMLSETRSPEAAAQEAREELAGKLTRIQEKIDVLDTELERTDLKVSKRRKLEKKLQKLLDKKTNLIDGGQAASDVRPRDPGQHQH